MSQDEFDEKANAFVEKVDNQVDLVIFEWDRFSAEVAAFGRECAREARAKAFEEVLELSVPKPDLPDTDEDSHRLGVQDFKLRVLELKASANPPAPCGECSQCTERFGDGRMCECAPHSPEAP